MVTGLYDGHAVTDKPRQAIENAGQRSKTVIDQQLTSKFGS
jgi:hypothetical protein